MGRMIENPDNYMLGLDPNEMAWYERPRLPRKLWDKRFKEKWENEPDLFMGRETPDTPYPFIVIRAPLGAWNGYVGIPKDHPFYGKGYDEIPVKGPKTRADVDYARENGQFWAVGFSHGARSGNHEPAQEKCFDHDDTYQTMQDTIKETFRLARQLYKLRMRQESKAYTHYIHGKYSIWKIEDTLGTILCRDRLPVGVIYNALPPLKGFEFIPLANHMRLDSIKSADLEELIGIVEVEIAKHKWK